MLEYEHGFWSGSPGAVLAGVDEVGRGPLAGPGFASAVAIAPADVDSYLEGPLAGLTDSKKLTRAARERFCRTLGELPGVRIGLGSATVEEIDQLNILRATHLAMRRAILDLGDPQPAHVLVDGLPPKGLPVPFTAIVKGDAQSLLIAAASVVAKVRRDAVMAELDATYPGYGFASNAGYGTPEHLAALKSLGASPVHRRSFAPVAEIIAPSLFTWQ